MRCAERDGVGWGGWERLGCSCGSSRPKSTFVMSGTPLLPGTSAPCWDVLPSPQACWLEGQHDLLLGQFTNPATLAPSGASTPEPCLLSLSSSASLTRPWVTAQILYRGQNPGPSLRSSPTYGRQTLASCQSRKSRIITQSSGREALVAHN